MKEDVIAMCDGNGECFRLSSSGDELLAALVALAADYRAICGDGMVEGTEPEVLKAAEDVIAKYS